LLVALSGRLRESFRHHPWGDSEEISIFKQILEQKQNSTNKIYSIHEPQVYCISKGKDQKKYEF
jgi:hypothetical protein